MSKRFAICTLFEGGYHLGVAPLANSLYASGFRGVIWAGYRGPLPAWAKPVKESEGCAEFQVGEGCVIRFVALETQAHFTNYKPDFMLRIFEAYAPDCDGLFYLDPDIVVCERWSTFEEWIACGVAVCEDVNSPFAAGHPRRVGWRRFYKGHGIQLRPKEAFYANGGFVGVRREDIAFLELWKRMQDCLWKAIGGAEYTGLGGAKSVTLRGDFPTCFDKTDQDVLNAAIEAAEEIPVSFENQQAMGFKPGKALLPHALGQDKPWKKNYLRDALRGIRLRMVDKAYWRYAEGPICLFTPKQMRAKRLALKIAALLGRFIQRG
ncbi:MAG: hypothetical protein NTZ46_07005 [Verrucomicrobia bacterium]|nr:hypothetical protein [Verrucomicrobiota bacterium]